MIFFLKSCSILKEAFKCSNGFDNKLFSEKEYLFYDRRL